METIVKELENKLDFVDKWLCDNIDHPRYEEGFEKFRKLLQQRAELYLEEIKPVQERMF